jgi:putative peptidoglycan lipid II flippase
MTQRTITKAASFFSSATLLSRVLGFVRDVVLANYIGATALSDAFFVAFRIPNLLRELFAEGSISSAFVPVLTEVRTLQGEENVKRVASRAFTFILLLVGAVCVVGEIVTPLIVKVIAPGFTGERFSVTVFLTRLMFPFLLFVALAAFTMGALNVKKVFFIPALAPAWFNVTIISTILILCSMDVHPAVAAAIGVTFGGFMQFATQAPTYIKKGYSFKFDFRFNDPWLKKMGLLILPSTMGMAVVQLNIFVSTILASFLPEGSIAYLYYSMRLILFPVGVFGVAMAMAVLPTLSEHATKGDTEALREDFSFALRLLMVIAIPAMIGLMVLRVPIVNLLFQRGEFDLEATEGTAFSLLFYSLGIWSMVGVKVVVAAFYSMQDTKTPVKIAVVALMTNIILSVLLMIPLRHGGLALANAISSWINFALLFAVLRKRLQRIDGERIIRTVLKAAVASVAMGVLCWLMSRGGLWYSSGEYLKKTLLLSGIIISSTLLYFLISLFLRLDEIKELKRLFSLKKR